MEKLQEELASSCRRSLELEGQVAEAEKQVALARRQVAEAEHQLALLRGVQDATCAEAFQLGAEETRATISRKHPEWDLFFLEAEGYDVRTPGAELSTETEMRRPRMPMLTVKRWRVSRVKLERLRLIGRSHSR